MPESPTYLDDFYRTADGRNHFTWSLRVLFLNDGVRREEPKVLTSLWENVRPTFQEAVAANDWLPATMGTLFVTRIPLASRKKCESLLREWADLHGLAEDWVLDTGVHTITDWLREGPEVRARIAARWVADNREETEPSGLYWSFPSPTSLRSPFNTDMSREWAQRISQKKARADLEAVAATAGHARTPVTKFSARFRWLALYQVVGLNVGEVCREEERRRSMAAQAEGTRFEPPDRKEIGRAIRRAAEAVGLRLRKSPSGRPTMPK